MPISASASAFRLAGLLAGAALVALAGLGTAQAQGNGATPRPAFCIMNQVNGVITAEISAGKAKTQVQLPAGQEGCCVKFCAENPATAAGYRVAIMAQPPGGISHELCKATVKKDQLLDVVGTLVEGKCSTRALP